MTDPAIAATALLLSATTAHAQEVPPPVEDPPPALELVHLVDVASLEFEPDPARVGDWSQWPATWENDFFLVVDQTGKPIHCEPYDPERQGALADRLCADLLANARLDILEGYGLGGKQGVVALNKEPFTAIPGLPGAPEADEVSVRLVIGTLDPQAFTQYAPLTDAEKVKTEGLDTKKPKIRPDYPLKSLRAGHEGTSAVMIEVGADAQVLSCRPFESSGYARLDSAACRYVLEHFEFDLSDVGVADAPYYFPLKMTWLIPDPSE